MISKENRYFCLCCFTFVEVNKVFWSLYSQYAKAGCIVYSIKSQTTSSSVWHDKVELSSMALTHLEPESLTKRDIKSWSFFKRTTLWHMIEKNLKPICSYYPSSQPWSFSNENIYRLFIHIDYITFMKTKDQQHSATGRTLIPDIN